jgi:CRISPR/Cas system-associated endoribonuclease Cas2
MIYLYIISRQKIPALRGKICQEIQRSAFSGQRSERENSKKLRNKNLRFYAENSGSVQRTAYSGQGKTSFLSQKRASEAETPQGFGCRMWVFTQKTKIEE